MRVNYLRKIKHFNRPLPLVDYLIPFVGDKKEVRIADVGAGPFSSTGQLLDGVKVEVVCCDRQDFQYFWDKYQATPIFKHEVQDMEKLAYPSDSFDIVVCINALDHTQDALAAVKELIRICKPGGWVYINCALDQHSVRGHKHFWDAKEDGTFSNEQAKFDLKDFGFKIDYQDNHGRREYNYITATLQK